MNTRDNEGPIVYVVQETGLNIAIASEFGKLVELLPGRKNISINCQPVLRQLREKLRDFNDEDFLLLLGDPIIIALSVYVAAEINNGRVKVLKYDRKLGRYFIVKIDVHDRPQRD